MIQIPEDGESDIEMRNILKGRRRKNLQHQDPHLRWEKKESLDCALEGRRYRETKKRRDPRRKNDNRKKLEKKLPIKSGDTRGSDGMKRTLETKKNFEEEDWNWAKKKVLGKNKKEFTALRGKEKNAGKGGKITAELGKREGVLRGGPALEKPYEKTVLEREEIEKKGRRKESRDKKGCR